MKVEWVEEKRRLKQILAAACIGFACFICFCLFLGVFVVALCWNTNYLISAIASVCILYGVISYFAYRRFFALLTHPDGFFAATRAEVAEDIEIIKQNIL